MVCTAATSTTFRAKPFSYSPRSPRRQAVRCLAATRPDAAAEPGWGERAARGAAAFLTTALVASAATAGSITYDQLQSMTYKEVKGSGLANQCPILGPSADDGLANMPPGSYRMDMFCMEPNSFQVKPVGGTRFEPSTLLTRNTYSLDQMTGTVSVAKDGTVTLAEEDGFDFQPVTVKLRGGEEVPLMFAVKNLKSQGPWDGFTGQFDVNAYRGATFMDPVGRGGSTGWDYQKGLQAAGNQTELDRENFKRADPTRGEALFAISRADPATGEVGGVFVTRQFGSDDMGSKDPPEVQIEGTWYAQLSS